ncbi:MAG: hypothetical protein EGR84_01590 [Coprococcus catus]|nr:hypothetical protein [Coprococcus catus]
MYNIGAADAVTKAYIRKNEVFADAFNYFMYDGEQKIRPEQLRELDTTEIAILLNEYRDLLKSAAIMEDGEAAYVLLGIENQTEVHYAMPVRNMLDMSNPIFEKYAQDYKLHIISPQQIADDELEKFHSSLREVIGCIKYSNDKNKLANFIQDNPRMNMEIEAAMVIETITSVTIEKEEVDSMGNVNMCKAIQEMMQDSRDEGRLAGLTEGRLQLLTTLIQSGKVTVKEAATLMDMTQEEFLAKSKTIS